MIHVRVETKAVTTAQNTITQVKLGMGGSHLSIGVTTIEIITLQKFLSMSFPQIELKFQLRSDQSEGRLQADHLRGL